MQGLTITDIYDNFPVFHNVDQTEIKENDKYIYSTQNEDIFCDAMGNVSWGEISRATDARQAFHTFHKHLIAMYNKPFPKMIIKWKYSKGKPWLSEGLKNSIKLNNKLYLNFEKINSAHNNELHKSCKRKWQQLMEMAEKQQHHNLLAKYSNDMKTSLCVIKSIINENQKLHVQGISKIGENLITSDSEYFYH